MNKKSLALLASSLVSASSFAAVDISEEVATLTTDGTSALTTIGGAMIGLAGIAVVFKWAKAAMFG